MNAERGTRNGEQALWKRAEEIAEFCVLRGAALWEDWPVRTLFAYVFFHLVDRTVFSVRERGEIAGVLFAWGAPAAIISERAAAGAPIFAWRRSEDKSDALFLAEVIGRRELLPRLVKQAEQRWPDWRRRRVFTFREDKLVELKKEAVDRLTSAFRVPRSAIRV